MAERDRLIGDVVRRLGNRRLVWVGLRGDDIEPLADIPQLHGAYSVLGTYRRRSRVQSLSYEELAGVRVDPEVWDIDDHLRDRHIVTFRRELLRTLAGRAAILPYRPSEFLSSIYFARYEECLYLGQFSAQQSAFEHKPWVETAVADLGLPRIGWTYVANEDQARAREISRMGSVVLRRSRTSGGNGFIHVDTPEDLMVAWEDVDEAFMSVGPYIDGALPVNVGGVVWRDGVTVHHPSVQLVGVESCTRREFGYCGNDFGLIRELDVEVIDQIDANTKAIGAWLGRHGYLGAFGVDFLVRHGVPLFTEVNPRFQGSTSASCQISIDLGRGCILLEHIAAWLGLRCPATEPLREVVAVTPDLSNLVVHWTGLAAARVDVDLLVNGVRRADQSARADVLTPCDVHNETGSTVARFALRRRITQSGFDLSEDLDNSIEGWQDAMRTAHDGTEEAWH